MNGKLISVRQDFKNTSNMLKLGIIGNDIQTNINNYLSEQIPDSITVNI